MESTWSGLLACTIRTQPSPLLSTGRGSPKNLPFHAAGEALNSTFLPSFSGKIRPEPAFLRVHLLCFTGQEGWPLVWENLRHTELLVHSRCCRTHQGPFPFLSAQEWLLLLRWMQYLQCERWVSTGLGKWLQDINLSNGFKHSSGFTETKSQLVSSWSGLLWWLCAASPQNAALCSFGVCSGLF